MRAPPRPRRAAPGAWGVPLLAGLALASCGAPERPPPSYIDEMRFVDDSGVQDSALEPAGRRDVDLPRARRRVERGERGGSAWKPPRLAPPRCASPKNGPSRSIGRATSGALHDGCLLPARGRGYVRRNKPGWGTDKVVSILQWAFAETARLHPGTVPVVVGSLSRRGGGRMPPHRSHQSGRDVDIGYFATNNSPLPHFRPMTPRNIDLDKTWTLIAALLRTGQVQYVFIDYELQALLVGHLEDEQADPAILARLFQFPAGRGARRGVLRHVPGHDDHFHVRFRCQPEDGERCVD